MSSSQNIVKYGSTRLSAAGRLSQIWNSSSGFGLLVVEQREHLAVDDAVAGGEPLHVTVAEARRCAERIRVVDEALAHERDRLEAAVRVLREARARSRRGTCSNRRVPEKSWPMLAAVERGVGAELPLPRG